MATAYGAYGASFKRGSTVIALIKSISGPSLKKDTIETTHLLSTSRAKTFISSLRDGGEVDIELFWDPVDTTHEALEDDWAGDAAPTTFSIIWPDAAPTTWSFAAMVVEIGPKANLGDALMATYKIKLSGVVTTD